MDVATQKQLLLTRRAELAGHLIEVEHALDEMPSKDWEDRSSERQGDEVLDHLGMQNWKSFDVLMRHLTGSKRMSMVTVRNAAM